MVPEKPHTEYKGYEVVYEKPDGFYFANEVSDITGIDANTIRADILKGKVPREQLKYYKKKVGSKRQFPIVAESAFDLWGQTDRADKYLDREVAKSKIEQTAEAKFRTEMAKAEKAELELLLAKNEVIYVEAVRDLLMTAAVNVRQSILSLVPRLAPDLVELKDMHAIQTLLENELTLALSSFDELSLTGSADEKAR